ncbi:18341_t:CDS:2 [Acaulospora morrowiae]|uniref:18341_t:CDS:1 n=1 Tax=Acaulospora morrowiae TaxID=94023 RepID=A0A9N9GS72_9GLOM|nr:18341_t:CDS:2 [Acaulospora morrowiae]
MSTFDLHSVLYVGTVNSNLICCICQTPFVEPVVVETCGSCIEQALSTRLSCPVDRSPLSDMSELKPASKIISNMVNELLAYCPNKDLGCIYQGQRQLINIHLKGECEFTSLECQCGKTMLKKDLTKHMESCQKIVKVECPYCRVENFPSLHILHLEKCPKKPVSCYHAEFECSWSGLQHDLDNKHIVECPFEPLKGFFKIHKERMDTLDQENKQLRFTVQELKKTNLSLQNQVSEIFNLLNSGFPSHDLESKGDVLSLERSTSIITTQELLLSDNDHFKNQIEALNASFADLELRQNVALMTESLRMQEEIQSLKNLCHGLRMQMHYLLMERRINDPTVRNVANATAVTRAGLTGHMIPGRSNGSSGVLGAEVNSDAPNIRSIPDITENERLLQRIGPLNTGNHFNLYVGIVRKSFNSNVIWALNLLNSSYSLRPPSTGEALRLILFGMMYQL